VTRTTVVVADSLPVFGSGVRKVLERERDFAVVEASTLDELVAVCAGSSPDIALVDLHLPPVGGIAAVRALGRSCTTRSIIWSFETDAETVLEAIRAGACGFLARDLRPEALVRALRGLANGQAPISRVLALSFIDALHRVDEGKDARDRAATLSARELEVLTRVAGGARNREIADALRISEFTVKRHMHNILEKLDVPSRNAAGAFYRTTLAGQAVPA
jgi:two-component system nitrate/nitrite response regulator NarL